MDPTIEPPFCPNPSCRHHTLDRPATNSTPSFTASRALVEDHPAPFYTHFGSFRTKAYGLVARYRCTNCGRTFSDRSFRLDYYAKRVLDLPEIFRAISAGESVSAIARAQRCSTASVQNRLDRLGRASLAMHATLTHDLTLSENLAADGFESFDRSQYFPNNLNILIGSRSQFLYAFTHATLRRKGRMTPHQKRRRTALEQVFRPPPDALLAAFTRLVTVIPSIWNTTRLPDLILFTDEHRLYPIALQKVPQLSAALASKNMAHVRIPSSAPRTVRNPLFPVNYEDRELRKDIAAFRRESTCFTRNAAAGSLRMACHLAWHNYQKPHRIRGRSGEVHAQIAGIEQKAIQKAWNSFFIDRPFLSRTPVPDWAQRIWLRRIPTPLATSPDYVPAYAKSYQHSSMN